MAEKVEIDIVGKDKLSPVADKASNKIASTVKAVGKTVLRLGSMVTVATIAMFAGVTRAAFQAGEESAKAVDDAAAKVKDAQANLAEALSSAGTGGWSEQTTANIAALRNELMLANQEYDKLSANTKKAAAAYNEIQAALEPVRDAFKGVAAELLTTLAPEIVKLAPDLITLAKSLVQLVVAMTPLIIEATPIIKTFIDLLAMGAHFASKIPWGAMGAAAGAQPQAEPKGFANGGSFVVGGSGGIDSQLVQFRATPGEQVTVGGGGKQQVEVNVYLDGSALAGVVKRIVQRGY